MEVYINALEIISAQNTFLNKKFWDNAIWYNKEYLSQINPIFKQYLNPMKIRRMSNAMRAGLLVSLKCLEDAKVKNPDAIITCSSISNPSDTEKFLKSIFSQNEENLNPSIFMNSTSNALGSTIALMINCTNYNMTYVDKENALEIGIVDAIMLLNEGNNNVLLTSNEEITDEDYLRKNKFGWWRTNKLSTNEIYDNISDGVIPGEGSAAFVLSNIKTDSSVSVENIKVINDLDSAKMKKFLQESNCSLNDVDVYLSGMNGTKIDKKYKEYYNLFKNATHTNYKHLCGQHSTDISFAMYLAILMLQNNMIPDYIINEGNSNKEIKKILIHNIHSGKSDSLILLSF